MSESIKMPWSNEAERGVIGAMLLDAYKVVPYATSTMKVLPEAFYSAKNRIIYATILKMCEEGSPVDVLTVSEKLKAKGNLQEIGGLTELNNIMGEVPSVGNAEYYMDLVRQEYIKRSIIEKSRLTENEAGTAERGDDILTRIPQRFLDIIEGVVEKRSLSKTANELIADWEAVKSGKKKVTGLMTPWNRMNEILGGMDIGLYVIAGRPSQGKTTVEDIISVYNASIGNAVARVTLDLNERRLLARAICRKSGVSLPKLKNGHFSDVQAETVREVAEVIAGYPMFINDYDRDIAGICTWARSMKIQNAIKLLTVDYVQQVRITGKDIRMWNENQEITYVSQTFKGLANELKIPIILLSQLNRDSDRGERIPALTDLRGSGSIEQDAAVVIMSYKDKSYPDINYRTPQWLDVQKNQDGDTGGIEYWFMREYFDFQEDELGAFVMNGEKVEKKKKKGKRAFQLAEPAESPIQDLEI
ncbi:MAG: DnaB-like helicase C-terminal domain-containing protein [Patescibacteria group bacterium]